MFPGSCPGSLRSVLLRKAVRPHLGSRALLSRHRPASSAAAGLIHPSAVPTVPTAGGQGQQDVSKQGAVTKEEDRQQTCHKDKAVQMLGLSL